MVGVFLKLKLFIDCEKCQSVGYDDFFWWYTIFKWQGFLVPGFLILEDLSNVPTVLS